MGSRRTNSTPASIFMTSDETYVENAFTAVRGQAGLIGILYPNWFKNSKAIFRRHWEGGRGKDRYQDLEI